jgi:hypothetical protein
VLKPWRDIAGILGMTLSEYLEGFLREMQYNLRDLDDIGEDISDFAYQTREQAEAVAERFEAFAIEAKLAGESDVGTVAAEVVPANEEGWTVKAHYLSPTGKRWRSTSVIDDSSGLNDSDEEWKE